MSETQTNRVRADVVVSDELQGEIARLSIRKWW